MGKEGYKGKERRSFNRILYNPKERPSIEIDDQVFEVADISEKGLRLVNDKKTKLDIKFKGKLAFLCGESLDVEGLIVWQERNELGVQFDTLLPSDVIYKEQRHILVNGR